MAVGDKYMIGGSSVHTITTDSIVIDSSRNAKTWVLNTGEIISVPLNQRMRRAWLQPRDTIIARGGMVLQEIDVSGLSIQRHILKDGGSLTARTFLPATSRLIISVVQQSNNDVRNRANSPPDPPLGYFMGSGGIVYFGDDQFWAGTLAQAPLSDWTGGTNSVTPVYPDRPIVLTLVRDVEQRWRTYTLPQTNRQTYRIPQNTDSAGLWIRGGLSAVRSMAYLVAIDSFVTARTYSRNPRGNANVRYSTQSNFNPFSRDAESHPISAQTKLAGMAISSRMVPSGILQGVGYPTVINVTGIE